PPFRLYLVLSVVLFLVAASVNHRTVILGVGVATNDSGSIEGVRLETNATNETPEQRATRVCEGANFEIGSAEWQPRFRQGCRKIVLDGGHQFIENFYHNLPR